MWVPGGQRWSDAVGCGLPFATQALRNASDRHAEAWVCLVNQCAVSLRPCASPSLAQCLRGPVQAWLSKARRHAQARCSSVSECTAQLRPDASARKKNVVCVLGPHWQTLSEEPPGGSGHRQVVSKVKGLSCIATCGAKALQDRACRLRVGVRRRPCDYRRCAPRCVAQEAQCRTHGRRTQEGCVSQNRCPPSVGADLVEVKEPGGPGLYINNMLRL